MQKKGNDTIGGLILLGIGLVALLNQLVSFELTENFGLLILPGLGAFFLAWGILTHHAGRIIPGGILSGIGWGIYAIAGPLNVTSGDAEGGIFLIALGLGFGLITLLTAVFTKNTQWWALIPGGIIALIGTAVIVDGFLLEAVGFLGKLWPLGLILLGVHIVYHEARHKSTKEKLAGK